MTDTVVICLTVLVALAGVLAWVSHTLQVRATRADAENKKVQDLAQTLGAELTTFSELTTILRAQAAETPKAVLALSERVVTFEAALKASIAQMTNITGYEEAKYQNLLAKTVTSGGVGSSRGARPAQTIK